MSLKKIKKIKYDPKDVSVLKSFEVQGKFFIPFLGPIFLWKEYHRIKKNISTTSKRLINSRKTFHLSLFGDILAANIMCWILIVINITLLAITGSLYNWELTLQSNAMISLWSVDVFLHLVYIYFYFSPFVVQWKILEGLTMIEMLNNKKMESGVWFEA